MFCRADDARQALTVTAMHRNLASPAPHPSIQVSQAGAPCRRDRTEIFRCGMISNLWQVFPLFVRAGLFWILVGACIASTGFAASLPNFITRVWKTDDGLPGSGVTAVIQSRDGYLWIGTRNGLARFDGVRFTVFDGSNTPEMQSPHVTSLFEDREGTLWIGHETGELTCYKERRFHAFHIPGAWHSGRIYSINADSAGDVWVLNDDRELVRVKDGLVISPLPDSAGHLLALTRCPAGGLWIQRNSEVAVLQDGQLKHSRFDESTVSRYIQGIGASRDGGLWVMTESRVRKWKDGRWTEDLGTAPWGLAVVDTLIETRGGYLAAATSDHGLCLIFPGKGSLQFWRANGFPDDWITSVCEDREGNLWVGTGNSGLVMLRAGNITTVSPPDQWQGRRVLSVACGSDGTLWIGTEGAGLYSFHSGSWTNFADEAGLSHHYVWSVVLDAQGRIWAGTWGGGLFVRNGSRFEIPSELTNFNPTLPALLALPHEGLLAGTGFGLAQYQSGKITWLARRPELPLPDVRAVARTSDGTVWFGTFGGGLGLWKDGTLRLFRREQGLSSDFIQCLRLESDETLWIGTYAGLNRMKDGHLVAITKNQGLQNDMICDIEDDGLGYYWISSHHGIMRVNRAELNRCADGQTKQLHCLTYGMSDGLPTLECSGGFQPAACRTEDGRLWFPTGKGLVAVDPHNVISNILAPPVLIERLLVDDQVVNESPTPESPIRIAPGQHRFEFQFTALSFTAPEKVRFRYRLEGLETKWVEAQSPRSAYYSHLSPGNYRFQVLACNNDEVWNDAGATLAFNVLPAFWQTWWFRLWGGVMTAAAGGGVVWLDSRRRMQRKLERLERQQAIERERTRIARDIHDDLGAGLTRISFLSESVPAEEVHPPQAAEVLSTIFLTTHEMTQAMDEIVWAVNPRHDTLDSLATYLGKFAQDFLESAGVRCRLEMPVQLPTLRLGAETRHNLFLACKEALNNVLRHAAATEVRVILTIGANVFTIVVEDNGKGFASETAARESSVSGRLAARNGLANMKQRLEQVGGQCLIRSAIGKGTTVEFHVAVHPEAP